MYSISTSDGIPFGSVIGGCNDDDDGDGGCDKRESGATWWVMAVVEEDETSPSRRRESTFATRCRWEPTMATRHVGVLIGGCDVIVRPKTKTRTRRLG